MITHQQIKERLNEEKDPLQYIDGEIGRCISQMSDRCENVQNTISANSLRANENDQIDMQTLREELMKMGELYFEISTYLKVRKEQVKHQKRAEQLGKAQAKRQQWMEQEGMKK